MSEKEVNTRARSFRILRLFFGIVLSFMVQYVRARLTARSYDFFRDSSHNRARAIRIRETALEMGGVLIKVGQFLSSRVDLLPSEYIEELALLQDEVPGVSFELIRRTVETELGAPLDRLFRRFDPVPVAAASLGQVHRAALHSGAEVAVKVQRPGIREVVDADLGAVRYIVTWLQRHTAISRHVDLSQILLEFEETLRSELDYIAEGHHAERLSIMFRHNPQVAIPRIYWSHSTARVLSMQFIAGVKVTDFAELESRGISRSEVAEVLMGAYLHQILDVGFFHADPHPGNIYVQRGPVVVLLDFGMVGEIPVAVRENITRAFIGIIRRDYDTVIRALQRLGFFTRLVDTAALKRVLTWGVDTFYDASFGDLRSINPQQVLDEVQDVLFHESFQIPANFAFLGRAVGTLSGLCTALDPSFQFVTVAEPFARNLIRGEGGVKGAVNAVAAETRAIAGSAYALPFLTRNVLEDLQSGELNFRHQFVEVVAAIERLERSMRRIVHSLFVVAFLVAGALIFRTHYSAIAFAALALSLVFMIAVLSPFRRRR